MPSNKPRMKVKKFDPTEPAPASEQEIYALQALYAGEATDHQQKMALQWIINHASGAYTPSFVKGADGERDTNFALGRAFVGQQIIGLLKINMLAFKENNHARDS